EMKDKQALITKLKMFARGMKVQISALYLAIKDPAVPKVAKWLGVAVVAYALSPIDLIPDFIPVIGYLDDLIILPLGIYLAIKLIPEAVWSDCLAKAELHPIQLPRNRYAAAVIIGCWILFAGMCSYGIWYLISN
ncbi:MULTISPECIES: YkvA family protein, partial [unclassified Methylophaga]